MCVNVSVSHLAAREDATTEGTFVVEETADEIFVVRHFDSVHHVLQRVVDIWLLKQRDDELAAPPAGQVVQRQQTPAHPLHRSTPGEQGVNAAAQVKPHREVPFNYIKTTFPCQHRCPLRLFSVQSNLLVRVVGVDRRLGLVGPDALVEGLQERALQQRQSALHLASAEPQGVLALRRISEAERVKLLHLQHNREGR